MNKKLFLQVIKMIFDIKKILTILKFQSILSTWRYVNSKNSVIPLEHIQYIAKLKLIFVPLPEFFTTRITIILYSVSDKYTQINESKKTKFIPAELFLMCPKA